MSLLEIQNSIPDLVSQNQGFIKIPGAPYYIQVWKALTDLRQELEWLCPVLSHGTDVSRMVSTTEIEFHVILPC